MKPVNNLNAIISGDFKGRGPRIKTLSRIGAVAVGAVFGMAAVITAKSRIADHLKCSSIDSQVWADCLKSSLQTQMDKEGILSLSREEISFLSETVGRLTDAAGVVATAGRSVLLQGEDTGLTFGIKVSSAFTNFADAISETTSLGPEASSLLALGSVVAAGAVALKFGLPRVVAQFKSLFMRETADYLEKRRQLLEKGTSPEDDIRETCDRARTAIARLNAFSEGRDRVNGADLRFAIAYTHGASTADHFKKLAIQLDRVEQYMARRCAQNPELRMTGIRDVLREVMMDEMHMSVDPFAEAPRPLTIEQKRAAIRNPFAPSENDPARSGMEI